MDLEKVASNITRLMLPHLNAAQNRQLEKVLSHCLFDESTLVNDSVEQNDSYLDRFLSAKRLEGCSERTISYYESTIRKLLEAIDEPACDLGTEQIRSYLSDYQKRGNVSRTTVDNVRRIISSFYSWLEDENHIIKSPVRRIKRVKSPQTIKETYSDEVIEILSDGSGSLRDLALIDLLRSTGMRVGELVTLDKDAVDVINRECVVHGKGDKTGSSTSMQRRKSILRTTLPVVTTIPKPSSSHVAHRITGSRSAAWRRCLGNLAEHSVSAESIRISFGERLPRGRSTRACR